MTFDHLKFVGLLFGLKFVLVCVSLNAATVEERISAIKSVEKNGGKHVEAIAAVKELSQAPVESLPTLLRGFEGANPLAVNWLRGAVDSVADRALKTTGKLPVVALEDFIKDTQRSPEARRLAYEWLLKVDATAADRLIPGLLYDASPEFRRDAVSLLITEAKKARDENDKNAEVKLLQKALSGAVDNDQVKAIVGPLRELGETVDLHRHFGFLTEWNLIGPFDNQGLKGFDTAYAPETEFRLQEKYQGKDNEVTWQRYSTDEEYGVFDIAKKTSAHKGAITYAATEFVADQDREIEIRLGTPNAWKLWVNGELVFAREEYHRGTTFDQYRVTTRFKSGPNRILLKVCQNEQTEEWAQAWSFQLRICDRTGIAIPQVPTTRSATN